MNWPSASNSARDNSGTAGSGFDADDAHHAALGGAAANLKPVCYEFGSHPFRSQPQFGITAHALLPCTVLLLCQHIMDGDEILAVLEKTSENPALIGAHQNESLISLEHLGRVIAKRRGKHAARRQRPRYGGEQNFNRATFGRCVRVSPMHTMMAGCRFTKW